MSAVLIATVAWAPPVAEWPGSVATSAVSRFVETARHPQIDPVPDERPPRLVIEQPSARRYTPVAQYLGSSEPDLLPTPTRKLRPVVEATPTPKATPTPAPEASPTPARERPPKKKAPPRPEKRPPESPRRLQQPPAPQAPAPQPPAPQPPAPQPPAPEPPAPTYSGTSRFWYPALGMKAAWKWYGCEYGGDPNGLGAGVYRWGCVPKRNVYLMSHAWSTFKAVRRGFHSGAMKTGQSVWYADNNGDVSKWKVKWIKRVTLDYFQATSWDWAANDSASPIMTLQTCDGRNDEFRIIVRLVPSN